MALSMGETFRDLAGLARLHELDDISQIQRMWRRGMATLAAVAAEHQPVPLEGLPSSDLLAGVRIALNSGLFDGLTWLSPAHAALAMFELASTLPRSAEKRELGRRVLTTLQQGNADTFVTVATALALGSSRSLSGPSIRSRLAVALSLPVEMSTGADSLALALISHRDSVREWLSLPATGSLPSRRLAARLLERAAREAARRAAVGDSVGVRAFEDDAVKSAFAALLADRESLIWRHVASARGLLSEAVGELEGDVLRDLGPELSPTEWRRAAASLAARFALAPDDTARRCREVLDSPVFQRDPGVAAAMIYGISGAGDAELEAADELLDRLVAVGGLGAIEALADVRRERIGSELGHRAAERALTYLRSLGEHSDDGEEGLKYALCRELAPQGERSGFVHERLASAQVGFAQGGIAMAKEPTEAALEAAHAAMRRLEQASGDTPQMRREAFCALRELDLGILETTALGDLLTICSTAPEPTAPVALLFERLSSWLLERETAPLTSGTIDHPVWRLRRLRTLLHVVDADGDGGPGDERRLRARRLKTLRTLLHRVHEDQPSPLRRAVCATLARTCDAAVREELYELSEVFIAAAGYATDLQDLTVLTEASMEPAFETVIGGYAGLLRACAAAGGPEGAGGDTAPHASAVNACLAALDALVQAVPTAQSPRVEALRSALLQFASALRAVSAIRGLVEFAEDTSRLHRLEVSAQWLAQLSYSVSRRIEPEPPAQPPRVGAALRAVDAAVERAIRGDSKGLLRAASAAVRTLRAELPPALAECAALVLLRAAKLPVHAPALAAGSQGLGAPPEYLRMVPWLPLSRRIGEFYLLRPLGRGAVSSVFLARRGAEGSAAYAVKVPEYHGSSAQSMTEAEFTEMFCQGAQALRELPEHPSLARIVAVDTRPRPRPYFVMDLVPGPTLQRVLEREEFSVAEALAVLNDVAAGLEAMHKSGLAHLDIKPAHIILKPAADPAGRQTAVLVDFGLAGRVLRPGCGTARFAAPEIWTAAAPPPASSASKAPGGRGAPVTAADVYAFACLAFELLTSEPLFTGETTSQLMSAHRQHDGKPPRLRAFERYAGFVALARLLASGLRPDPAARASIAELRAGLIAVAPELDLIEWPIVVN